jgi:glycosyltransferase involved in cell wall biosynthesis
MQSPAGPELLTRVIEKPAQFSRAEAPPLKVLYVITSADYGGAQIHLRDLISALKGRVEPVIATGKGSFLIEEAHAAGIPVHIVPHLTRPIRPVTDLIATAELARIIRIEKPAIVHAHTSKAGVVARLAATLTGTPKVFTVHSWSFVEGSSWLQDRVAVVAERIAAKLGGLMITVSESNRNMGLAKRIGRPEQMITVWNGMHDIPERAVHGPKRTPRVVMVARFVAQKDHATLLRALAPIESPWFLSLAGDGPLLQSTKELSHKLGIADRIAFLGRCDDVGGLLAESDIFVLSSLFEGMPLGVLEAMRAGLPLVATDNGGTREAVTDGVNGYLIPVGNDMAMRGRLTRLLHDSDLRSRFGAASRLRYEADFRVEIKAARTMAVYRTVLERSDPIASGI